MLVFTKVPFIQGRSKFLGCVWMKNCPLYLRQCIDYSEHQKWFRLDNTKLFVVTCCRLGWTARQELSVVWISNDARNLDYLAFN